MHAYAKNFQLFYCFSCQLLIKHTDSVITCRSGKLKSLALTPGSCINGDMVTDLEYSKVLNDLLFFIFRDSLVRILRI